MGLYNISLCGIRKNTQLWLPITQATWGGQRNRLCVNKALLKGYANIPQYLSIPAYAEMGRDAPHLPLYWQVKGELFMGGCIVFNRVLIPLANDAGTHICIEAVYPYTHFKVRCLKRSTVFFRLWGVTVPSWDFS